LVEPVQPVTAAKTSNILDRIDRFGAFLATPDEFLHRLRLLVPSAEVSLSNSFPHELRDGRFSTPCTSVKGIPKMIVKV